MGREPEVNTGYYQKSEAAVERRGDIPMMHGEDCSGKLNTNP